MTVQVTKDGPVTIIAIDRPEVRNAVDGETAELLAFAFREFEADEVAAIAVLHGTGDHFCAGADLKALAEGRAQPVREAGDGPMGPTRLRLSKPVIAAIEGYAVAGGLELALWCDLRVASESAVFGVFCRRVGVPLVDLGTIRLPRLIGHGRAMDMILTGRPVAAREAMAIGLASRVVPRGGALHAAREIARGVAAFPQVCLRNDRASVLDQWDLDLDAAARNELRLGLETIAGGEAQLGAEAFAAGEGRHGRPFGRRSMHEEEP